MKKLVAKKTKKQRVQKMTLDTLGSMVAEGFVSVDKRIDGLEETMDARFTEVNAKLGALHNEVLSMDFNYRKVRTRLENVELKVFGAIQEA